MPGPRDLSTVSHWRTTVRSVNALRDHRAHRGFTLIEMMITVAVIGILAAIAIPSFVNYQNRSRRSESFTNLAAIARLEQSYFSEFSVYTPPIVPEPGTSSGTLPGVQKRPWTAAADASFAMLGWRPEGDVFHDYDVNTGVACPDSDCFTAAAYGDADGDTNICVLQYVQPNRLGVFETTQVFGYAPPRDPVTNREQLNEVAINYVADEF